MSSMEVFSPHLGGTGSGWPEQGPNRRITKITTYSKQPPTISLEPTDNDRRKGKHNEGSNKSNVLCKSCKCNGWLRASQLEHDLQKLVSVHGTLLTGLHKEIDQLKQKNRDLTFQLLMGPYASGVRTEAPLSPESDEVTSPKNEQHIEVKDSAKMDESSASANPRSCVLPDKSLPSGSNDFANNASADKAMLPDLQETHADNAKLMSKAMPPASNNNAMNNTCVLPNISASAAILSTHEMPDLPNSSSTVFNKSLSQKNQPLRPLQEENMVVIKRASRGRAAKGDPRLVRSLDLELLEIEADEVRRQLEEEKSKNKYLSNLIDDLKRQVSEVVVDLNTEQHTDPEVGRSTSHDLSPPKTSVLPPHRPPPRPPPRTTTMHHRPPQVPNNTGSQRRMHEKDNSGSSKLGLASCSPVRSTSKSRSSAPSKIEPLFPPLIHHSPSHQDHSLPSIRNTKQRSRGRKKSQRSSETKEFSTVTTLPEVNGTKENSPKRTQEQQQLTNGSNLQEQHQHHRGGRVREHGRGRVRNRHQQQQYQQQHDQRSQGKTKEITQHEDREDNHFQGSSSLQQSHRRSSSLRRVPGTRQMQQKEQQQSPELSHYEYENCDKSVSRDVFQSCQNDKHVLDSTTDEMNSSWEQQHQAAAVASTSVKQETDNKSEGRKGRGRHHRRGRGKSRREKAIHNQQVPNED